MNSLAEDARGKCDAGHSKELLTSDSAKWRSLYLRSREKAYSPEPIPIDAFANPSIILVLERSFRISHFSAGQWRKIDYTRGMGILTPAGHPRLVRHDIVGKALNLLLLVVPQETVDFVAQEVQKPNTLIGGSFSDRPFFDDPVIGNLAFSVTSALRNGAPDFTLKPLRNGYPHICCLAQPKVLNGVSRSSKSVFPTTASCAYSNISKRTFLNAWIFASSGISPFQFAALFRKAVRNGRPFPLRPRLAPPQRADVCRYRTLERYLGSR
jgi:AraC family transcriptional regulator